MNKYHAEKTKVNGITFDSKKEAERYCFLHMLEKHGQISNLTLQKSYELIPSIRKDGQVIERACTYKADFVYTDKQGKEVVEDAKGMKTAVYKIKKKLMLWRYGIKIIEV